MFGPVAGETRNLDQLVISGQWLLNFCIYGMILSQLSRIYTRSGPSEAEWVGFTSGEIGELSGWIPPDILKDWESYPMASPEYEPAMDI